MSTDTQTPNRLYFAVWRWHFYAGLYVIPFVLMLAVTGFFIMLFTTYLPEYGDRLAVEPKAEAMLPSAQASAAIAAVEGGSSVSKYIAPLSATTPALITVTGPETPVVVALDPYSGVSLRQTDEGNTWNDFLTDIHGSLLIGDPGDRLIEIAAGLGLLLVVTGLYMWWPRGTGFAAALWPNLAATGRAWWKSLHVTVGVWFSLFLVFFLVSGLAWAGVWGGKFVQAWSTFPAEKWDNVPLSDATHASMNHGATKDVPWPLEQTQMPESGSFAGQDVLPAGTRIDLDALVVLARMIGFEGRFQLALPGDDAGVYTLSQDSMSYDSQDPTADRTVHVDQFTGKVLADVRYGDYSVAGKAMAVGIALHEAQLGLWNFVLNVVYLLAILFLGFSGIAMWWKRRPSGVRLGAPPRPEVVPYAKGAILITLALSLTFPMLGLTLLAVMLLDVVVLSALPPLKRALG